MVAVVMAYGRFGAGFEFFVASEPLQTQIQVFARGNYSPDELRNIMLDAERRIQEIGYYSGIVTQSGAGQQMGGGQAAAPDLIGTIFIEFTDRRAREVNGFDIAGKSVYCDETGGDYYDFISIGGHDKQKIGVAIGDVSGHGISSALLLEWLLGSARR